MPLQHKWRPVWTQPNSIWVGSSNPGIEGVMETDEWMETKNVVFKILATELNKNAN